MKSHVILSPCRSIFVLVRIFFTDGWVKVKPIQKVLFLFTFSFGRTLKKAVKMFLNSQRITSLLRITQNCSTESLVMSEIKRFLILCCNVLQSIGEIKVFQQFYRRGDSLRGELIKVSLIVLYFTSSLFKRKSV